MNIGVRSKAKKWDAYLIIFPPTLDNTGLPHPDGVDYL